jgi:hypothetical protein
MTPPVAVFLKELTPQGLIQYMNDTTNTTFGSGVIVNSEVGDEFANNQNFPDLIKLLSEAYDLGIVEATYTKGKDFRNNGVHGVPINALYIGSQAMILFNEATKNKFVTSFMSKLSRRSFFVYSPESMEEDDYTGSDTPGRDMYKASLAKKVKAKELRKGLADKILKVTEKAIKSEVALLELTEEADYVLEILKRYDYEVATAEHNPESIASFAVKNRYWKTLKLSGSLAILDNSNFIDEKHLIGAINITEMFMHDLQNFEKDLHKAAHERLSDYLHTQVLIDGKAILSAHELKKNNFLVNINKTRLHEMVNLCASYDREGIYSVVGEGSAIQYEPVVKTDTITVSYKTIDTRNLNRAVATGNIVSIDKAKQEIAIGTAYGYETGTTTFLELIDLLSGDFAYNNFRFRNGARGRENVIGPTKWVILDIDESVLTITEAHFLLMDLNHYISLSSNPNNEYKFRILLELDAAVELNPVVWKHFIAAIAEDLALKVDILPQSQIFFSYSGRSILSQLDAEPLAVRDYIMRANEKAATRESVVLTAAAKKAKLNDPLSTFQYAYEAPMGQGSRSLIRAALHAKTELGSTMEETLQLVNDIQDYWESPMEESRFDKILNQVSRMF